jgi:hypothetical protein
LLAAPCSIFGRQMLYHRLRAGGSPLMGTLDEAALQSASHATAGLHQADTEVAGLLFEDSVPQLPTWTRWLGPLAWALPAAIALWAVTGAALGGVAVVVALVLSARAQIALHGPMVLWHRQRRTLLALLDAAQALNAQQHPPWQAEADALHGDVQRLRTALGPSWVEQVPALADYANLLALYQYRRLSRELTQLRHELPVLQQVYQHVAGAEADLAVQQHLRATALTCVAEPAGPRELDLQDVVHPLVQPAHALSLRLDGQGALITGRNGAGKSTLAAHRGPERGGGARLRLLLCPPRPRAGRHRGGQPAGGRQPAHRHQPVHGRTGPRAGAVTGRTAATPVLVLIDEIFRGTNHLESVAATAALAHELAGRALLLLATHHVVLAPLLGEELQPLCVSRDPQGAQQLTPGVLEEPNGLAMLADYGFAPATQATAAQVLAWLQGYMAHPSTFPRLGGTPTAP